MDRQTLDGTAKRTMDEYLIQVKDFAGRKRVVTIRRSPFTIGRDSENDLVLHEPSVSKRHATLRKTAEGIVVADEQSRNGVFINDEPERITEARLLKPQDTLRICSNRLRVVVSPKREPPRTADPLATVVYYPSRDNWDTIRGLRMSGDSSIEVKEEPLGGWQEAMSRLLVEDSLPKFYEIALGMIERAVSFDRCLVILLGRTRGAATKIVASRIHKSLRPHMDVCGSILERVVRTHEAVLVTTEDLSFQPTQSFIRSGAVSAICIPLIAAGKVNGVIYIDRQTAGLEPLSEKDIVSVGPLAGLIALRVENLRLEEEQKVSEVIEQDLELARLIQQNLLPREVVHLLGYSIEGHSSPCYQVGGDYFDLLSLPEGDLIIAIGDVSGKGISSALYMASIRASLHAHVAAGHSIETLMSKLERHARETFRPDHFLTLFLGRLNPASGVLSYCNAGHLPPIILRRDGGTSELAGTDPALNLVSWPAFRPHEVRLARGDLLALYTDGLIEAEDAAGEQFTAERLVSSIAERRSQALPEIRKGTFQEIDEFIAGKRPGDDRTLLLLRRERDA